ncbi:MAG: DUF721 domain-containing protein [Saprospiraceae bacterium]|nr:DUF721 domain-containing protein [Saprospiraceae bacterium]
MRNDEIKLNDLLKQFSNQEKLKTKLTQKRLEQAWKERFKDFEAYTRKIRYFEGQMTVELDSAVLSKELSYSIKLIIRQLNEHLGEELIKSLIIR